MDTVSMQGIALPGATLVCETCGVNFTRGKAGRVPRFCSERCRKASYAGTCSGCGKATSGTNGPGKAPSLCVSCHHAQRDCFSAAERERAAHISATATRWTDAEVAAALHACAADAGLPAGHGPSVKTYVPWQRAHVAPTAVRITQRFGRWRLALEAAGLIAPRGTRKNHARMYTAEMCLDAIRECAERIGHPPTYEEYSNFARRTNPRKGARIPGAPPSPQTIRNTVSRSWLTCLEAALR